MKPCYATVVPSPTSNPKLTFSWTTIPGPTELTCHELIKTSTVSLKNNSTHHLIMMKVVLHSKRVSYYLPLKRWSAKEQLALATLQHLFSSHSVYWPSRNYYPYWTHLFLLLIVQESGGLLPLLYYWKLGNLLLKVHFFTPSDLHHVLSNFRNAFLLIVFITRFCFISNTFINNARLKMAKNQGNTNRHPEAKLCYLKTFYVYHPCYRPEKIEHILKNKQKNRYACVHEIIRLIIIKMKLNMKKDHIHTT